MPKLKITHIAQIKGYDWYYIRFVGGWSEEGEQAWNAFKDKLKASKKAKWYPKFTFNDGKSGAWYVDAVYLEKQSDTFSNYDLAMERVEQHDPPVKEQAKQSSQDTRLLYAPSDVKQALQILNVQLDRFPTKDDIKKQYRTLALANHPDIGGDIEQMKIINRAKDTVQEWLARVL